MTGAILATSIRSHLGSRMATRARRRGACASRRCTSRERAAARAGAQWAYARRRRRAAAPRVALHSCSSRAVAANLEDELDPDDDAARAASAPFPRAPGEAAPARRRGGQAVEASLAISPSFLRAAEQREAPALFDDLTEGGSLTATQAVARFPWRLGDTEARAVVFAKALDLLPRERSVPAWSFVVCELYGVMLEDLNPIFRRARADSFAQLGSELSFAPRRGRFGWRQRARWAGLL